MRVVVDTSAIIASDIRFASTDLVAISQAMERIGIDVLIPDVVIDELVGKTVSLVRDAQDKIESSIRDFNRITGKNIANPRGIDVWFHMSVNHGQEIGRRLRKMNMQTLPYPNVPHWEVARRSIDRTKPFNEKGTGYRDFLIWATILHDIDTHEDVNEWALISGNTKDFFEKTNDGGFVLHPDLVGDMSIAERKRVTFQVFESLNKFRRDVVDPRLGEVSKLDAKVLDRKFLYEPFRAGAVTTVKRWFDKNLATVSPESLGLPEDFRIRRILSVSESWTQYDATVRELPNGGYIIDLSISIDVEFGGWISPLNGVSPSTMSEQAVSEGDVSLVAITKSLKFIISAVFGSTPTYETLAMDAILLTQRRASV